MLQARKVPETSYRSYIPSHDNRDLYSRQDRLGLRAEKSEVKGLLLFLSVFLVLVALAIGVIIQHSKIITTGYALNNAEGVISQLHEDQRELKLEAAGLSSLDRIERIARHELGMLEASENRVASVKTYE